MDIKYLTVQPHDQAPDVLCGPDGLRIFIGAGGDSSTRIAVAKRIEYALRLAEGLSDADIEAHLKAAAEGEWNLVIHEAWQS